MDICIGSVMNLWTKYVFFGEKTLGQIYEIYCQMEESQFIRIFEISFVSFSEAYERYAFA